MSPHPCQHDFENCSEKDTVRALLPFCRVSKVVCAAVQSLMIRQLVVSSQNAPLALGLLQKYRSGPRGCKFLSISVLPGTDQDDSFSHRSDIVDLVPDIACLHLFDAEATLLSDPESSGLIKRLVHDNSHLKHLSVSHGHWTAVIMKMINTFDLEQLWTLDLDVATGFQPPPFSKQKHGILRRKVQTSAVRTIRIRNFPHNDPFVQALIHWPKALVEFSLTTMWNSASKKTFGQFSAIVTALKIHAASLKTVNFTHISQVDEHLIFDATQFPHLETIRWSRWQMHKTLQFVPTDANLLGPSVHTLIWDFDEVNKYRIPQYESPTELTWNCFGDPEADWLENLANTATALQRALKEIQIIFTPTSRDVVEDITIDEEEEIGVYYPWDWMDAARSNISNTIALTYNPPNWTREGKLVSEDEDSLSSSNDLED